MMTKDKSDLATIAAVLQLLGVFVVVVALFLAKDVFIPLALGVLLSFLLSPIVNRLQRTGIPNVLAVVATATLAFVLLAGGFTLLGRELTSLVSDLPKHKGELIAKAKSLAGMTTNVGGSLDKLADEVSEAVEEEIEPKPKPSQSLLQRWTYPFFNNKASDDSALIRDGTTAKNALYVKTVEDSLPIATWATTAGTVLGPLATAGLVCVFSLFMLIHRVDLRDRIISVISHGNYVTTTEALDEVGHRISRYLVAQTIINTSYGFVLAIGLTVIGATMTSGGTFPNAMLWGILATCLRYIPYVGPFAGATFPLVIAFSVFPGYSVVIAVAAFIIAIELVSNNLLEPWLYGSSTGISAVAVIVAAVFWGWLWGPVGLLLSTPMTVCLVVLGRHVPRFKIFSTLFGDEVGIRPALRFYQRLLANDQHRGMEMLRHYANVGDVETASDGLLIPAIKRIRTDHRQGHLTDGDAQHLIDSLGELIQKIDWVQNRETSGQTETSEYDAVDDAESAAKGKPHRIVGCPSHHASESLILDLLNVASTDRWRLQMMDEETLPLHVAEEVVALRPTAVVIIVMPEGGFAQSRYLCRLIRKQGYRDPIIVACFGRFKQFDKLFVRFRKAGATSMTTTFLQTRSKLDSIVSRKEMLSDVEDKRVDSFKEQAV
ncbi:MAG: AI-2E family transporter [Pirellulaceae bacterium]